MDISIITFWWLLVGITVVLELFTGNFYLLMLAIGFFSAAVVAHLEFSIGVQMAVAALTGMTLVAMWHVWRKEKGPKQAVNRNRDVHMDVGSMVEVVEWTELATAHVMYRGARWSAQIAKETGAVQGVGMVLQTGMHRIVSVEGNTLILEKV